MTSGAVAAGAIGIDFGTTNSVVALAHHGEASLVSFGGPEVDSPVFRSALCFWEDSNERGGLGCATGPWAIAEYLDYPHGSRFLQSFKSVAASASFEHAMIFERRMRFEDLGRRFLEGLRDHAKDRLKQVPERIIVGRPVRYVGANPDEALARSRYDAMFAALGRQVHYVYEPMGAAFSFAARLSDPVTLLVADFGGGTSDFSIVRIHAPGSARRCEPLGSAGIGIAGDRFDYRIMDHLVLPMLGKGGHYRSFDKTLEIPPGHFKEFGDWSRLALMRNKKTLAALEQLKRAALDPEAIGRMIAVIDHELGYPLYDAIGKLKRALSADDDAHFHFASDDLSVEADVKRSDFERWISSDLAQIAETVDSALANAGVDAIAIDHVFLTGGSSLIPAVRQLFVERFGENKLDSGEELTSIAHGLALIGEEDDLSEWTV